MVGTSSTGLMREEMRAGMNFSISLLETRAQSLVREARAAFLTSDLVSAEFFENGQKSSSTTLNQQRRTPDGVDHDGNDVGHSSGALIRRSGDEEIHDFETSSLDLPFSGGLDLLEEDGEEDEGRPRGGGGDDGLDGFDGGDSDGGDLVGESFRNDQVHDLFEEEGLDGVSNSLLDEDAQQLAGTLSRDRVLLVGESLFDGSGEAESDERLRTLELDEIDELNGGLLSLDTRRGGEDDVDVDCRVGRSWDGTVFSFDRCWVDFDGRRDGGGGSRHRCWH